MKKYIKIFIIGLICSLSMCTLLVSPASAFTEPRWNMSPLVSSFHYTDKLGRVWYPPSSFYLPQFLTGVNNADGKSTYYRTSIDGGMTWKYWENFIMVNNILTPSDRPVFGYDYYYQFEAYVTNSDPQYNYKPYFSGNFYVDDRAPEVHFSPVCCPSSDKPINVVITADDTGSGFFQGDTGSGLNHYIYRTSSDNGSTWGSWSGNRKVAQAVTFTKPGAYQIEVEAWDNVGNMSDWVSGSYIVDEVNAGGTVSEGSGEYRTNTDVITSVTVSNSGGDISPDIGANVTFNIPGITSQTKTFVLPAGASEPVWFKWHTPSTPQNVNATISINAGSSGNIINATFKIYDLTEKTPPDPQAKDKPNAYFQYEDPRAISTMSSTTWNTYSAHQEPKTGQIWNPSTNKFDTYTYKVWVFTTNSYYANLTAALKATPDTHCPTATQDYGVWNMKSGYGIQENVTASMSTNNPDAVTGAQNVIGYYPEFMYDDTGYDFGGYNRIFEMLTGGFNSSFSLKANKYSMFNSRVHFLPVWWHDGTYQPTALIFDSWSPNGMLSIQSNDTIDIKGNVFGDFHVLPHY